MITSVWALQVCAARPPTLSSPSKLVLTVTCSFEQNVRYTVSVAGDPAATQTGGGPIPGAASLTPTGRR